MKMVKRIFKRLRRRNVMKKFERVRADLVESVKKMDDAVIPFRKACEGLGVAWEELEAGRPVWDMMLKNEIERRENKHKIWKFFKEVLEALKY